MTVRTSCAFIVVLAAAIACAVIGWYWVADGLLAAALSGLIVWAFVTPIGPHKDVP